jgi:hypothetical protein
MCVLQRSNLIGDEGAKFIGEALKVNTSLQTLFLVSRISFCFGLCVLCAHLESCSMRMIMNTARFPSREFAT